MQWRRCGWVVFLSLLFIGLGQPATFAKGQVIVIDPGHGGVDGGATAVAGRYLEKDLNLEFSKRLKSELQSHGYQVYMTREGDTDATEHATKKGKSRHRTSLMGRVQFAEDHQADLFISIHGNKGTSTNRGPLVISQPEVPASMQAAKLIQEEFNKVSGINQHVVKGKKLYLISHSEIPVVLVEIGFLSNPAEASKLRSPEYQKKLAQAIVAGVQTHFSRPILEQKQNGEEESAS